jgi:hypothetical protein
MNTENQKYLESLYQQYNTTVKILISDVEVTYEEFPASIFNEIRAFNDHIARCYFEDFTEDQKKYELEKAASHIKRIVFDCFKYLNVYHYDELRKFDKMYKNVNLLSINNGDFLREYSQLRSNIVITLKEAKKMEARDKIIAFNKYQETYNLFKRINELLKNNNSNLFKAKVFFTFKRISKFFLWLGTAVLSGIVSYIIFEILKNVFKNYF